MTSDGAVKLMQSWCAQTFADLRRQFRRSFLQPLVTDMVMPGAMSGADFTERVRQDHPTIKPILTSGYALEQMTWIASIS